MCDVVVVSIFVNPAQFGPAEDFASYPRDLTNDTALLTDYNVDYIYAPPPEEIYPKGFSTFVTVEGLSDQLEGASRPGHFRGVATVVTVLLNTVRPDFVFFGQKDAQQVLVVKRLVRDLSFPTEVVVLPIVREESGLAMSSRNAYLNQEEHKAAQCLYEALSRVKDAYAAGERNASRLAETVRITIGREPLARVDYINVSDADTLEKLEKLDDRAVLIAVAAKIGKTRLIDNIVLGAAKKKDAATSKT